MINLEVKHKKIVHTDEYYYSVIRENMKRMRKAKNLTQQDLADLTDISREYICDIENESRNKHITITYLSRVADALEVDISELFNDKTKKDMKKIS